MPPHPISRRHILGLTFSGGVLAALSSTGAQAAGYPDRTITLVVPFPPGGGTDAMGRWLAQVLAPALNSTVIVENVAGATGTIGSARVARANPDGYTILLAVSGNMVIAPAIYKNLSYSPTTDFVPLGRIAEGGNLLAANPHFPANDLKGLIAMARKPDSHIMVGSWGIGSGGHLALEAINQVAHVHMTHVPYKGVGPEMQDLVSGQIQVGMVDVTAGAPMVRAGRIKALAVTGPRRSSSFPEVPTLVEQGVAFDTAIWYGLFAPAHTPKPIVDVLSRAIDTVLQQPGAAEKIQTFGMEPARTSREAFAQEIQSNISVWAQLVRGADIHID